MINGLQYLILVMFFTIACSSPNNVEEYQLNSNGVPKGQLKGYFKTEVLLKQRIIDSKYSVLSTLVQGRPVNYLNNSEGLLVLMGVYQSQGSSRYINGIPNGLNFLLYWKVFSTLAKKASDLCSPGTINTSDLDFNYKPKFKDAILKVCNTFPQADLKPLWQIVMGYTVPEEEYHSFIKTFQNADYQDTRKTPANTFVSDLMLWMFMNPYFLLEY